MGNGFQEGAGTHLPWLWECVWKTEVCTTQSALPTMPELISQDLCFYTAAFAAQESHQASGPYFPVSHLTEQSFPSWKMMEVCYLLKGISSCLQAKFCSMRICISFFYAYDLPYLFSQQQTYSQQMRLEESDQVSPLLLTSLQPSREFPAEFQLCKYVTINPSLPFSL